MKKSHIKLAADLLEIASDKFANHSCNDFDLPESWSDEECDEFTFMMQQWNGDPENHEPGSRITMDWFAMAFLSKCLRELSEDCK